MVNKNIVNTVTINGKPFSLNAKIGLGNTARLGVNNAYIASAIYAGATVGNIVNPKAYPNANIANAIKNSALAKAGVTLNALVFSKSGLGYFYRAGNITITA